MARRQSNRHTAVRKQAVAAGFRSGFEHEVATALDEAGVEYEYESLRISYQPPAKHYVPDFILPNGIIVEVKGRFTSADRAKHRLIKGQRPDLDIRFLFRVDNKLNSRSTTRYSDWCERHGFKYAFNTVPEEWLNEEPKEVKSE